MSNSLLTFTIDDVPGLSGAASPAASSAPQPTALAAPSGVDGFIQEYMPLAQRVSEKTGVAPEVLLGQWGLETGWGKSVIPGTNNLGNIKDPTRRGPMAKDNLLKTSDSYMQFDSPDAFGDHYTGLLGRRYRGATGTGSDALRFFTELQRGGYAQDKGYVDKGVKAANMVSAAMGRQPQSVPTVHGTQREASGGRDAYYTADRTPYIGLQGPGLGATASDFFKEVAASAVEAVGSIGQAAGDVGAAALNASRDTEEFQGVNILKPAGEAIRGTMTEGGKRAREDQPQGDVLDASTWKLPNTLDGMLMTGGNAFGSLAPMLFMSLVPGLREARIAKAVQESEKVLTAAQAAGDAAKIAQATSALSEAQSALKAAGIITKGVGAASESTMTGGAAADEVRQTAARTIATMPHEELLQVPAYRENFERTGDERQARMATVNSAAQWAGGLSAIAGAGSGAFNAKVIEDILLKRGVVAALGKVSDSRVVRVFAGGTAGHFIEGGQELAEKVGQNAGENIGMGRPAMQNVTRDTFGDFFGGALVGGPMGGLAGGMSSPERQAVVPLGLEKVAEKAAEGGTLSKAAMKGAAATAAAQQTAPAPADPAARLAELEAIGKDAPDQVNADGQTIPGTRGRLFTAEEQAEYQKLKSLKDATDQAAGRNPQADATAAAESKVQAEEQARAEDLKQRSAAIADALRKPGALQALRAKDSPVNVQSVLNDLAAAQSPSTDAGRREQALSRLEFALEWAGVNTAPKSTDYDTTAAAERNTQVAAQQDASNQEAAASLAPQVEVDRLLPALKVTPALRSAEQTAIVKMAQSRYQSEDFALLQKAATYPAGMSATEKLRVQQLRGTANPALKVGRDSAAEIEKAQAAAQPPAPKPTTVTAAAPLIPHQGGAQSGGGNVATPAAHRKRRAQLRQIIDMGITRVERREDGFYLTDGKREYKLDGPADAALARAEHQAKLREGAEQANTNPTEGQKRAGNYKKGRVEFDGLKLGIENPIGSTRAGTAPNGKPWSVTMSADYGDLTSTTGADGDGVDVYLAKNPRAGSPVFVFDQYKDDGSFDEHKAVLGVNTLEQAAGIYDAHFSDGSGPRRRRGVKQMSVEEFKAWANSPAAKKPAAGARDGQSGSVGAGLPARGETGGGDQQRGGVGVAGAGRASGDGRVADGGNTGAPARRSDANPPAADAGGRADVAAFAADIAAGKERKTPADVQFYQNNAKAIEAELQRLSKSEVGAGPDNPETGSNVISIKVAGKKKTVQKVDIDTLGTDSPKRGARKQRITKTNAQIIQAIAQAFGKDVVFFRDPDDDLGDGFVMPRIDTTIFINEESSVNHMSVFGHELMHLMQRDLPQVHQILRAMVAERIKDGGRGKFRDYYNSTKGASDEELNSDEIGEFTSDLGGEFLSDPKFWRELMDRVKELHPDEAKGLIAQLAAKLFAMIDHLVAYFKKQHHAGFRTSQMVDDLESIRAAYKDALAGYLADNNIRKSTMRAQQLRSEQDAKRSKARDVTQTEAFKKWFGDSKVVDNDGKPLVVYHGTDADVQAFAKMKRSVVGFFFTPDATLASMYAEKDSGNVVPVYLSLKDPLVVDAKGWGFDDVPIPMNGINGTTDDLAKAAKKAGYDGVVIKNVVDVVSVDAKPTDVYVAFRPEQIKSSIGNDGNFDPKSSNITRSKERDNALDETRPGTGEQPEASGGADGDTPRHGKQREGSVSATGIHFSAQPRKHLDAAYYGTGLKGAERERLSGRENDDIRPRVYFYVDKGQGVRPESGVGGVAHKVQLDNLYDVQKDPLGIVKDNPGANNWERAVMRAGFDGYLNLDPILPQGYAVLVGKSNKAVPVKQTNPPGFTAPAAPAALEVEKKFESKPVDRNPELASADVEKIPGAKLKYGYLTVPVESREEANAEMERIGSDVRFSSAREATVESPQFKLWFEGSKVVDENGKPLMVYHGTQADFDTFSHGRVGQNSGHATSTWGHFFSTSPSVAALFARTAVSVLDPSHPKPARVELGPPTVMERLKELVGIKRELPEQPKWEPKFIVRPEAGANIMPTYLSINNPRVITAQEFVKRFVRGYDSANEYRLETMKAGYDGIIIKADPGSESLEFDHDSWVAFRPNQIKSAIGNNGDFSKAVADITRSTARDVTGTPAFKRWFGGSQAVVAVNAETGEPVESSAEPKRVIPQVMYHTSRNDFKEFEVGRPTVNSGTFGDWETSRAAFFVTPELEASQAYGKSGGKYATGANVMPLYVKAENPLDLTDGVSAEVAHKLAEAGMSERFIYNGLGNWAMFDDEDGASSVEMIKRAGYDAVIFNDENPDTGDNFESWALFSPSQVKSAIGNDGSFGQAADITRSTTRISDEEARELGDLRRQLSVLDSIEKCLG